MLLRMRFSRVISIRGAIVGTQAAIMIELDSMLVQISVRVLALGSWDTHLVQMNKSAVASGSSVSLSFMSLKCRKRTSRIFGIV